MTTNTALTRLEEVKAKTKRWTIAESDDWPESSVPVRIWGGDEGGEYREYVETIGAEEYVLAETHDELETIATTLAEEVERLRGALEIVNKDRGGISHESRIAITLALTPQEEV